MIISCRWLSRYIELPADLNLLVQTLTFSGIEVEAVKPLPELPAGVVAAKVLSAEPIPGTDHLQVCSVEFGAGEPAQVVCGAPNCKAGMISVLALPGTELPGLTIKTATLRGVESRGMLCSERELGLSDNHAGIIELDASTPAGSSVNEIYELPDTILELEITPNRPDLLGYTGIARDLSASLGKPLRLPPVEHLPGEPSEETALTLVLEDPLKCPRYTARLLDGVNVKESPQWLKTALVKSGLRPINNIVDVTNFVMLELGHPLHAFDYGKLQPLDPSDGHPAVVARQARPEEEFVALDGKNLRLNPGDLVIADGRDASALAGVMGGKDTAISAATTSIVLEAACFQPGSIRATSYKHKLSTDSSYRFERHLSPHYVDLVSDRAVQLFLETAGGKVCNELYDAWPEPLKPRYLAVRPCRFRQLIGYELAGEEIIRYLEALGCEFIQYGAWIDGLIEDTSLIHCHHLEEEKAGKTEFSEIDCVHSLFFRIPPQRVDITREADLLEELARLAGYERIPRKKEAPRIMDRHAFRIRRGIEDWFADASFHETLNYSFCDPAQLADLALEPAETEAKLFRLVNPQSSNQSAMRITLLPQLLDNLRYNLNHGERNLKLMELGKVYLKEGDSQAEYLSFAAVLTGKMDPEHWSAAGKAIDFYQVKGLVEGLLRLLGVQETNTAALERPWLSAGDNLGFYAEDRVIASCGRLKTRVAQNFGIDLTLLKQDIWVIELDVDLLIDLTRGREKIFRELPRHPAVTRDLSFLIKTGVAYAEIAAAIKAVNPDLIRDVSIFDQYLGQQVPEGFRSMSLRIVVQDSEKTLTDERVDQVLASVREMLFRAWQINMR
ncbi:MAG: phenylalanine--tRNA ligase subunit beta [Candidatus Cloacimonetes bacterium]|nr:phenylalanine--tRNA ligase subunit beta [Candidatus Cloacimonadota bacterium]